MVNRKKQNNAEPEQTPQNAASVLILHYLLTECYIKMLYVTLCPFSYCNHLDGEERAGCFA